MLISNTNQELRIASKSEITLHCAYDINGRIGLNQAHNKESFIFSLIIYVLVDLEFTWVSDYVIKKIVLNYVAFFHTIMTLLRAQSLLKALTDNYTTNNKSENQHRILKFQLTTMVFSSFGTHAYLMKPHTFNLMAKISLTTSSYDFSCAPVQFSALKMTFDTIG